MKAKNYFSHDYSSRQDEKMTDLIMSLGYEGYGLYWAILELLAEEGGTIQTNYKRITFVLRSNEERIKSVIEDFGLFEVSDGSFCSKRLLTHLNFRKEKSDKAKEAINKRWSKRAKTKDIDTDVIRSYKKVDTDVIQSKGKERKVKERKVKTSSEKTPKEETMEFFKNIHDEVYFKNVQVALHEKLPRFSLDEIRDELMTFVSYWTEMDHSGKKALWQKRETFQVKGRLATWFRNKKSFKNESKPKYGGVIKF